jgi:hypothetical protein
MSRHGRPPAILALLCCLAIDVLPASAQGNGRGNAYGQNKRPSGGGAVSSTSGGTGEAPAAGRLAPPILDGSGVRAFGSWLDDASVMTPGSGYASFAVSYWRLPGFTEIDVPAFDVGLAVSPRVQVGLSLPVYHASEPGGPVARGVGDLQLSSKIQLRDPASAHHGIGVALTPLIEVLSVAPAPGSSRIYWALPGSVELRRDGWRTYGSAGYFSRGAVFASGAVEVSVTDRMWVTGTISQSRSVKEDDLSQALGLSPVRTDVSGGTTVLVTDTFAVFGSLGRTLSRLDPNRADLFVVGGLSINFAAWTR